MDSSSSSSSGRKASSSGGGGGVVCKKRTPPTTKKTFRYSYFIFAETQLCDSCTGKKPKHCPPSLKGWTVTAAIAKKSSKKKRRKNSTPASSSASSSSSSSWPPSTSSAAAGEDRQLGMFRGGARRAARFDWEIEGPPRALGHSSTRSPWLLLHCMWWEYNIAIEEEASLLGTRGRGRWKSCWSAQAFQDAWTELSAELDTAVDIPSTAAGEDRAFRTLLTWGVTTGVFKPPFQHRFQGSNFKWLANAFEDYQDFCFGKRLLWGLDMVPRTPREKIQELVQSREPAFRDIVTDLWADSPQNESNNITHEFGDASALRTEEDILGVAYAIVSCGLRAYYLGSNDHLCPRCGCCCQFEDCCGLNFV